MSFTNPESLKAKLTKDEILCKKFSEKINLILKYQQNLY